MRRPTFVIQNVSNHGTRNPIVARSLLQASDLYSWVKISKEDKAKLDEVHLDLMNKLLACYDAATSITRSIESEQIKSIARHMQGNFMTLPHVINLTPNAEAFLFQGKQYVRECVKLINLIHGEQNKVDARFFWTNHKGENPAIAWAEGKFGNGSDEHVFFIEADDWISELCKKRNAVEHPGEHSGTMEILNFRRHGLGIARPTWIRTNGANVVTSEIAPDMQRMIDQMLDFAEQISLMAVRHLAVVPFLRLVEIAEQDRAVDCPTRFRIEFDMPQDPQAAPVAH